MKRIYSVVLMALVLDAGSIALADSKQRMDTATLGILAQSQKTFEEQGADEALRVLTDFENSEQGTDITAHDLAHVTQMKAQFAISQGNLSKAIELLELTLQLTDNPEYLDINLIRYQLAQAYFAIETWDEGLAAINTVKGKLLGDWKIYSLKAQAHLKLGNKETARGEYLIAVSLINLHDEAMPEYFRDLGFQLGVLEESVEEPE